MQQWGIYVCVEWKVAAFEETLACKTLGQVLEPLFSGMGLTVEQNTGLQANLGDGSIKQNISLWSDTCGKALNNFSRR